jgi:hypothetical protein
MVCINFSFDNVLNLHSSSDVQILLPSLITLLSIQNEPFFVHSFLSHLFLVGSIHSAGTVMRLAPIHVAFHADPIAAMRVATEQSLVTHQGTQAADCCRLLAFVIAGLVSRPKVRRGV